MRSPAAEPMEIPCVDRAHRRGSTVREGRGWSVKGAAKGPGVSRRDKARDKTRDKARDKARGARGGACRLRLRRTAAWRRPRPLMHPTTSKSISIIRSSSTNSANITFNSSSRRRRSISSSSISSSGHRRSNSNDISSRRSNHSSLLAGARRPRRRTQHCLRGHARALHPHCRRGRLPPPPP